MKINRWIALAAIAVLVVAAMGFVSFRAFAWFNPSPAAQDCAGDTESGEANEAAEVEDGDVEECEQQGEAEEGDANEASESQDNGGAFQSQAAITQAEAEAIALAEYPGANVVATELENEGGILLYSVELDNGAEVEVDANTGAVLPSEAETGTEAGS